MTLRAGVAPWQRPARRSRLGRVGLVVFAVRCSAVVSAVLGGLRVPVVGEGGRARGESAHHRAIRVLLRAPRGPAAASGDLLGRRCRAGRASPRSSRSGPKRARCTAMPDLLAVGRSGAQGCLLRNGIVSRARRAPLSHSRWAAGRDRVCAAALGQGHGHRRSELPVLAGLTHLPGHEARELAPDRRLSRALRARSVISSIRSTFKAIRPASIPDLRVADPNLRIADVQRIGAILFPEIPGTDPFWTAGGRGLFLGMALVCARDALALRPRSVKYCGRAWRVTRKDSERIGSAVIADDRVGSPPLSPQCVRAISDIMDLAPVTASSIRKTFTSRLDLWANPLIDAATSRNDFDFRDLRKRPISIYIGIQPGDLSLLRPLLNLFIEQAIALQTRELPEHNPSSDTRFCACSMRRRRPAGFRSSRKQSRICRATTCGCCS